MRAARASRGFTVAEMMVSLAVLGVLSLALAEVYHVSYTVFDNGSGRIVLEQRTREALRRVGPLLSGAVPPTENQDAIIVPAIGNSASSVDFYTAEDLLGATVFDPRNPAYLMFRIGWDGGGNLVLWRLDAARNALSTPRPRVLARGLSGVRMTRTSLDAVTVQLTASTSVRTGRLQQRTVTYSLNAMVQLPYYGSRQ